MLPNSLGGRSNASRSWLRAYLASYWVMSCSTHAVSALTTCRRQRGGRGRRTACSGQASTWPLRCLLVHGRKATRHDHGEEKHKESWNHRTNDSVPGEACEAALDATAQKGRVSPGRADEWDRDGSVHSAASGLSSQGVTQGKSGGGCVGSLHHE